MSTWRSALWQRSDSAGPPEYGPRSAHQRDFYDLAFGWADSLAQQRAAAEPKQLDPFGVWWAEHNLSPLAGSAWDWWDFDSSQRRAELPTRQVSRTDLPAGQAGDVVTMWVPDPVPGRMAYGLVRDHYHVRYAPDGVIEVRIWERLGLEPPLIGLYGDDRYYMEVCIKGLLEAWLLLAEENWPGTMDELAGAFGRNASWDSGQLEAQVKFAVIEHMKDLLFSARVTNGRPIRRLTRQRWEDLIVKFIGRARWPKGPCEPVAGGRNGNLVKGYTMPVAGTPFPPRPVWTSLGSGEGWQGPEDYDHPALLAGGASTLTGPTLMWAWGGRRNGAVPSPAFPDAPQPPTLNIFDRDEPIRPPAPGSLLHLRVSWTVHGPIPTTAEHLAIDPVLGTLMDPGEYPFAMGDPRAPNRPASGPEGARVGARGITWCIGDDPAVPYTRFVHPDELYVGRSRYRDAANIEHHFPMYFDFSKAGSWELFLTVPDHGGELALRFAWTPIWVDVQDGTTMTFPIQLYIESPNHGFPPQFLQFPRAKLLPPPVLPQGFVETQAVDPGQFAITDRVHGDTGEPVMLYDPPAHGISTVRHA